MKGQAETTSVHSMVPPGEAARELTASASAIRGFRQMGLRAMEKASGHAVSPFAETGMVSTREKLPLFKSCQSARGALSFGAVGATAF